MDLKINTLVKHRGDLPFFFAYDGGYGRSEFRATRSLGRQMQEVWLHHQLPRHRPADSSIPSRTKLSPAPRHCHRNLLMLLGSLQVQPG
jgi:hypothetical protein